MVFRFLWTTSGLARARDAALLGAFCLSCSSVDVLGARTLSGQETPSDPEKPDELPNPIKDDVGVPRSQVNARLNEAFLQLFFGDPTTEAVFRDQGDGTGYVEDIHNGDVRTDSMGYGMLVTVQLNHQIVFDKLWSWTKAHMLSREPPTEGLLHWQCDKLGEECITIAATDSSSVIATSLFMAESRWGGEGAHEYGRDARALLDAALQVEERVSDAEHGVIDLFNRERALPRFGSDKPQEQIDVEYLMPAFYELWAEHDEQRAEFWRQMAENSRELLSTTADPGTGLYPEAVTYDGDAVEGREFYGILTGRTLLNLALDHIWYGPLDWVVEQNERRLDFFLSEGVNDYVSSYTLDGKPLLDYNHDAHMALVAVAAGTSTKKEHDVFMRVLLETPVPTGEYRYYSGMIYILSLLVLSGQMTPG